MTFKSQIAADLTATFFNPLEFGEAATYTPAGGTAKPITVIPDEEDYASQAAPPPGDSEIYQVQVTDIAAPTKGDSMVVGGVTLYFVAILSGGPQEGIWHIRFTRSARRDIGGRL